MRQRAYGSVAMRARATPPGTLTHPTRVSVCSRPRAAVARASIVTFDVDGTLVRSVGDDANKLHKEAFAEGLKVLGIDDQRGIDVIEHHGSTDGLILVRTAHFHGIDPQIAMEKLPEMQERMVQYFRANKERASFGIEVLPGVESLLATLSKLPDVYVGLTTGNLEDIGWMKMEELGLIQYFTAPRFGGFGNLYCSGELDVNKSYLDRAKLLDIAAQRAVALAGANDASDFHRVHVGDAPHDVDAAVEAGVFALGTLTGIFTEDDLRRRCGPAHDLVTVLPSLADTAEVLRALRAT